MNIIFRGVQAVSRKSHIGISNWVWSTDTTTLLAAENLEG